MIDIRTVQKALDDAGFYNGEIDGMFGTKSRSARDEALRDAGANIDAWPHSRRMAAIRQWSMKQAGFDPGPIDGLEGPKTIAAMSAYLASNKTEPVRQAGPEGIALIHSFENCKLRAYKDPGSKDGKPITIGWGSTKDANGKPIALGTVWTRAQCDARFEQDIEKYAAEVAKAIGDAPTSQRQFDALVSFHYNTGAIAKATLTKLHKKGDFAGAAREFGKWVKNDGKVMAGLVRRRAAERNLYDSGTVIAFSGGTGRPPGGGGG